MKRKIVLALLAAAALTGIRTEAQVKNIVLVHGAFAEGSGCCSKRSGNQIII